MKRIEFIRKGLIFNPKSQYLTEKLYKERISWMNSHAQVPTPIEIGKIIRVFFNTRPKKSITGLYTSQIGYVDLNINDPREIIDISSQPVLPLGGVGEFDEFGSMIQSCIFRKDLQEYWIYYTGWTRKSSTPYDWNIGLAISRDGGNTFSRYGSGPLITSTPKEPYLFTAPYVRQIQGKWHMWYSGGIRWEGNGTESVYQIKHATSHNGLDWIRDGKTIITSIVEDECQSTPSIIYRDGTWIMFFCYRHGTEFRNAKRGYKIGCATSKDLITWSRNDALISFKNECSIWDCEMNCYPSTINTIDKNYLFYCGNHFGQNGFGMAEF